MSKKKITRLQRHKRYDYQQRHEQNEKVNRENRPAILAKRIRNLKRRPLSVGLDRKLHTYEGELSLLTRG